MEWPNSAIYTIRLHDCSPPPLLTQTPFIMSNPTCPSVTAKRIPAPVVTPPPDRVVLEMDLTTAEILCEVMSRVGGDLTGPRKHLEQLRQSLTNLGLPVDFDFNRYTVPGNYTLMRHTPRY